MKYSIRSWRYGSKLWWLTLGIVWCNGSILVNPSVHLSKNTQICCAKSWKLHYKMFHTVNNAYMTFGIWYSEVQCMHSLSWNNERCRIKSYHSQCKKLHVANNTSMPFVGKYWGMQYKLHTISVKDAWRLKQEYILIMSNECNCKKKIIGFFQQVLLKWTLPCEFLWKTAFDKWALQCSIKPPRN